MSAKVVNTVRVLAIAVASVSMAGGTHARGEITQAEFQALSPVCQAARATGGTRNERLKPHSHLVAGSCGITHTCAGELALIRHRQSMMKPLPSDPKAAAQLQRARKYHLQKASSEFSYEIRCAPKSYPMLPQILTGRGNAVLLQGNISGAISDFQRALEINPNFAPARQGLAQAQIRAATAPLSKK